MNENERKLERNDVVEKGAETPKIEIPNYLVTEHRLLDGVRISIFDLNLEDVIFEKMFLMFDKLEPLNKQVLCAEVELKIQKDKLLLETDFETILNKKRPTIAEKEAYMRPELSKYEDAVDDLKEQIRFYKDKLVIINDLVKAKALSLKIEGALLD